MFSLGFQNGILTKSISKNKDITSSEETTREKNGTKKIASNRDYNENENSFNIVSFINKTQKTSNDIQIIISYLMKLKSFMSLMKGQEHEKEILINFCKAMKHEYHKENRILFRFGDKSNKFYIILRGKVDILLPIETKVEISEEEYIIYLANLKKNKENEILQLVLNSNKNIFAIDPQFENWLRGNSTLCYTFNKENVKRIKNLNKIMPLLCSIFNFNNDEIGISSDKEDFFNNICFNEDSIYVDNMINPKEYIDITNIQVDNSCKAMKRQVKIWQYHNILTLETGDKFGDYAFGSTNLKRKATIITTDECHFGILEKNSYERIFKEINEKQRRAKLNFLSEIEIFIGFDKGLFFKKYLSYFTNAKVNQSQYILEENKPINYIYFIKKGDFQVTFYNSLKELDNLITFFRHKLYKITNPETSIQNINEDDDKYNKFINKKRLIKLYIANDKEIIGLEDFEMNGKSIFSVECLSFDSEVYKIEKSFLKDFLVFDIIDENLQKFVNLKMKSLLERLISIKNMKIKAYNEDFTKRKTPIIAESYEKNPFKSTFLKTFAIKHDKFGHKTTSMINITKPLRMNTDLTLENYLSSVKSPKLINKPFSMNNDLTLENYLSSIKSPKFSTIRTNNDFIDSKESNSPFRESSFEGKIKFSFKKKIILENQISATRDTFLIQENQAELSSFINNSIFPKLPQKNIKKPIDLGECNNYMEKIKQFKPISLTPTLNTSIITGEKQRNFSLDSTIFNLKKNSNLVSKYSIMFNKNKRIVFKKNQGAKKNNSSKIFLKLSINNDKSL